MQNDSPAKQQIVDKIKQATNILVAVNSDPSVDALSAALALTLILNKLDKHGTAVFSGQLPQAMKFLEPDKTFENNVDSLRDFIISLNKEKADRLRYKVDEDVVRIFITPYRTTISDKDLQFSQGDFNVELIVCLGVEKREQLDKTIVAHGRILHDATVVTINAGNQQSNLGSIDWHDPSSSSLCEMLADLSDGLQPKAVDAQIATAILTGIVSATDRFSNQHTTPKVMTLAAQLMAAGANQQLVANNIQTSAAGSQKLASDIGVKSDSQESEPGQLSIKHEESETADKPKDAEAELEAALPAAASVGKTPTIDDLKKAMDESLTSGSDSKHEFIADDNAHKDTGDAAVDMVGGKSSEAAEPDVPVYGGTPSWRGRNIQPLTLTSNDDAEDTSKIEEESRNDQILTHDGREDVVGSGDLPKATTSTEQAETPVSTEPDIKPISEPAIETLKPDEPLPSMPALPTVEPDQHNDAPVVQPDASTPPSLAPEPKVVAEAPINVPTASDEDKVDEARKAVDAVLAAQPFNPAGNPLQSVGAQEMSPQPTVAEAPIMPQPAEESPKDNNLPPMPPMPSFDNGAMPPMPPELPADPNVALQPLIGHGPAASVAPSEVTQPAPEDPAQFKIPGA